MPGIGRLAVLAVLDATVPVPAGYRISIGQVGAMDPGKIISAVLTAAKRDDIWDGRSFREEHAVYDATMEALRGFVRGPVTFGQSMATVGVKFVLLRGPLSPDKQEEGDWVAVAFFGMIGAPTRGLEHEAIGLGINHI